MITLTVICVFWDTSNRKLPKRERKLFAFKSDENTEKSEMKFQIAILFVGFELRSCLWQNRKTSISTKGRMRRH